MTAAAAAAVMQGDAAGGLRARNSSGAGTGRSGNGAAPAGPGANYRTGWMPTETRRRVETPASGFSPDLRARTKKFTRAPAFIGRAFSGWKVTVAQPFEAVCTSPAREVWFDGT